MSAGRVEIRVVPCERAPQDRVAVFERGDTRVVVVADGAGGMPGGALASEALLQTAQAVAENATLDVSDPALWAALFGEMDAALSRKAAGETTGVVVVVGPKGLAGVSAGDTEAWIVGASSVDDLTTGQKRARLGSGRAVPVAFRRPRVDGVLLVATDGLFKYVAAERIAAVVREGAFCEAADRLVGCARLPSGAFQDDVGLVLLALQ
jgi:serine/threonine protein phosphatase PrpC